jgi:hypothetical protein
MYEAEWKRLVSRTTLSNDGNCSKRQTEVIEAFDQVWHVTSEQVNLHQAYFDALQNGTAEEQFPDGYTIPDVFLNMARTW